MSDSILLDRISTRIDDLIECLEGQIKILKDIDYGFRSGEVKPMNVSIALLGVARDVHDKATSKAIGIMNLVTEEAK